VTSLYEKPPLQERYLIFFLATIHYLILQIKYFFQICFFLYIFQCKEKIQSGKKFNNAFIVHGKKKIDTYSAAELFCLESHSKPPLQERYLIFFLATIHYLILQIKYFFQICFFLYIFQHDFCQKYLLIYTSTQIHRTLFNTVVYERKLDTFSCNGGFSFSDITAILKGMQALR
jgi:hypothetical protein